MLGPLCDQTDKINFFVKPTILKEICIFKKHPQGQPQKSYEHDILQKHLQITQSIVFCTLRDACHELLGVFGDYYASAMGDAEITNHCV